MSTNLDAARRAFADWAAQYETTDHPEHSCGGIRLLEALHACGVSAETKSLWSDGRLAVELICFADNGPVALAVFKVGAENCFMSKETFLRQFSPLPGDGERKGGMREGAGK